jgi:hypothetical protein
MLQNHSLCKNGRGCGQHPPEADSPCPRTPTEGSVNDSEEDRRFFADFNGFDWEEMSVLSMYKESYERPWEQHSVDSLGDEDGFLSRTEAWVASDAQRVQDDSDEECRDEPYHCGYEEEGGRSEGLRTLLEEMRRRSSEEGWSLEEQMAALEPEDKKDVLQIMREELGCSKKKTARKKKSSMSTMASRDAAKMSLKKKKKTSSKQTPTTSKH